MNQVNGVDMLTETEERRIDMILAKIDLENVRGETVKMMNRSIRRLAQKVNLGRLARIAWIDSAGRPPRPQVSPDAEWLKERAAALEVSNQRVKPILMGRNLIDLGMKPGVEFRDILGKAMELQLDGEILTLDSAINWAKMEIAKKKMAQDNG